MTVRRVDAPSAGGGESALALANGTEVVDPYAGAAATNPVAALMSEALRRSVADANRQEAARRGGGRAAGRGRGRRRGLQRRRD